MSPTLLATTDALDGVGPDDLLSRWDALGLRDLADAELVSLATRHLGVPRRDPADSFVLHAPLELMARAALLRHVVPAARERARQRLVWVAASFERYDAVDLAAASGGAAAAAPSVAGLAAAVAAGDLDDADAQVAALASGTTAAELAGALAPVVLDSLAAAGHAAIFLYHLPRLVAVDPFAPMMARGLVRELARHPDWRLTWMDELDGAARLPASDADRELFERLLDAPAAGDPGSHFIYPTMSLVEREGVATELLGPVVRAASVAGARRALLRAAALAMLQDDPEHGPYGWSHALTMPQATLAVAGSVPDPRRAVAVAATWVLGFRATLGTRRLDQHEVPARPEGAVDPATFLDAGPAAAAGAMWHADADAEPALVRHLVTYAALHGDAHLAKYTLACLDAARDDPGARRLYLAAAAHLAGWWRTRGADDALFG